jgi:hypothetical protein
MAASPSLGVSTLSPSADIPPAKRIRLSVACNQVCLTQLLVATRLVTRSPPVPKTQGSV